MPIAKKEPSTIFFLSFHELPSETSALFDSDGLELGDIQNISGFNFWFSFLGLIPSRKSGSVTLRQGGGLRIEVWGRSWTHLDQPH